MDIKSPRINRRIRKDAHKHSHKISKWIDPETVTRSVLNKAFMRVTGIFCYKYSWTVEGIVWGDIKVSLTNNGEYRSELSYDATKPFIIGKNADWDSAFITTPDGRNFNVGEDVN